MRVFPLYSDKIKMVSTPETTKLEEIIQDQEDKYSELRSGLPGNQFYKYAVDVFSGWLYYTPTYALQELASGKDFDTIAKTRLIGLAAHAVAMRPTGLLRDYVARKWNVTVDSPLSEKIKVNFVTVTPVQAVVYAGMLMGGMAWSGNYDFKSSAYAWAIGIALGAFHSIPYGFVQDYIRKLGGVKPAIDSKKS